MTEIFTPAFGIAITIFAFAIGVWLQKKTGFVLCNAYMIAVLLVIGVLLICKSPYEEYDKAVAIPDLSKTTVPDEFLTR